MAIEFHLTKGQDTSIPTTITDGHHQVVPRRKGRVTVRGIGNFDGLRAEAKPGQPDTVILYRRKRTSFCQGRPIRWLENVLEFHDTGIGDGRISIRSGIPGFRRTTTIKQTQFPRP